MLLGTDQVYGGDELMYAGLVIPELKVILSALTEV